MLTRMLVFVGIYLDCSSKNPCRHGGKTTVVSADHPLRPDPTRPDPTRTRGGTVFFFYWYEVLTLPSCSTPPVLSQLSL